MVRGIVLALAFVMTLGGALLAFRFGFTDQRYRVTDGSAKCHAFAREIRSVSVTNSNSMTPEQVADACVSHARKVTLAGGIVVVVGVAAGSVVFRRPTLPAM